MQKLEKARGELQRPEEDVVAYSVCTQVRQSLNGLLRSYLTYREAAVEEPASLESLFDRCKSLCEHFRYLDLAPVICHAGRPGDAGEGCLGPTHCLTFEEYHRKVTFAGSVMEIVFSEMRLSEKDLA
jgi:hypothetical protein